MKLLFEIILITVSFFISIKGVQGQATKPILNQIELIKQFLGTWQCELNTDTFLISDNKPFSTGIECNSKIYTKDDILDSVIQIIGYDKADKFIAAEQINSSPAIELFTVWFTSDNTGEIVITNPDDVPFKYEFEFRSPDLLVQTAFQDGKKVEEISLTRIKSDIK